MQYEKDFYDVMERIAKALEGLNSNFEKYLDLQQEHKIYFCEICGSSCSSLTECDEAQEEKLCEDCFHDM